MKVSTIVVLASFPLFGLAAGEFYAGLGLSLVTFLLVFGAKFFSAPYRQRDEARDRVDELEEEQKSRLDLVFRPESPFEFKRIAENTGAVVARTFRVQLRNVGSDRLDHCSVRLINVDGSKTPSDLPHKLKLMGDNPKDLLNVPHVQEFSLNPNEGQYIDVIHWDEAKTQIPFLLCYAKRGLQSDGYDNSLPPGKYDLTLEATANCSTPISKKFRVDVESRSMTFQEL